MESPKKIISISHKTFLPELEDMLAKARDREFKYEFIPVVLFNEKKLSNPEIINSPPQYLPKLLSLYENEVPIESLIKYIGDIKKEELSIAKRAFTKLQNFALQCAERVIADLCCQIILDTSEKDKSDHLVYFIERPASDKMLGRLGYLYFDLKNITICFISYEPNDMVTTVMSAKTGKLLFDIHRLMSSRDTEIFTSPYPGTSEDSLVQTYFFKPKAVSPLSEFLPIRIDIFCQGLLEPDIERKSNFVKDILSDKNECQPYPIKKAEPSPYVDLPLGLQSLLKSWGDKTRQKKYFYDQIINRTGEVK